MYIAMNRFRVQPGQEDAFEEVWRNRERKLAEMDGFVEFHLLRGPAGDDHTLFASHTVWRDEDAFRAWTQSQAFRDAHKNAGDNKPLYLGPPSFEGFQVVLTETA
ncbi:antibiotic biosynthesis monooxygenase family protein [Stappia sp.]|jgi:heme-degrading monooxygenase HmoA|uniref:antibiotic biosynthesis monooxygenase family protein n=1 Tax=Stappia sp. TaxID=1870903 RepID=UPI003A9A5B0C